MVVTTEGFVFCLRRAILDPGSRTNTGKSFQRKM
jgi:hypothetical protein